MPDVANGFSVKDMNMMGFTAQQPPENPAPDNEPQGTGGAPGC